MEHLDSADPQDLFLGDPPVILIVHAFLIELVRDLVVPRMAGVAPGEEEIVRLGEVGVPDVIHPRAAHLDLPSLDLDGHGVRELGHVFDRVEPVVFLLLPHGDDLLVEVADIVKEGDGRDRQAEIGGRFQKIPGEHPKASGIRLQFRIDGHFHGEIRRQISRCLKP